MPDITMCNNEECPLSTHCYRFNAVPNEHRQSYAKFEPVIDDEVDEVECQHYMYAYDKPTTN